MKRDDERDEALGALLREAAGAAARAAGRNRLAGSEGVRGVRADTGAASPGSDAWKIRLRAWPAVAAALAAALAVSLGIPALAARSAERDLVRAAAGDLSRSLISDSPVFLAELPASSELEAAAEDWAGTLISADGNP